MLTQYYVDDKLTLEKKYSPEYGLFEPKGYYYINEILIFYVNYTTV